MKKKLRPIEQQFKDAGILDYVKKEFPSLVDFEKHPDPTEEVDKYINDNYHVYIDLNNRDILVKMVMDRFKVSFNCASYWITMTTT